LQLDVILQNFIQRAKTGYFHSELWCLGLSYLMYRKRCLNKLAAKQISKLVEKLFSS